MPDDDLTDKLLTDYEAVAENLQHQVNVSQETMNRYHGMTGVLLAQCIRSIWTQKQLDEQVDLRITEKCKTCPNSAFIAQLKEQGAASQSLKTLALQNFKLIVICLTVIVSALATRKLPDLTTVVKALVPVVQSATDGANDQN